MTNNLKQDFWSQTVTIYIDKEAFKQKPQNYEMAAIRTRQKGSFATLPTLKEYLDAVQSGHSIVPADLNGGTSNTDWCGQQLFLVDIDNVGLIITPEEALEICNTNNIHPFEMHYTFSNTKEHPKYRIGFLLENAIDNEDTRALIMQTLISLFPTADPACKDASRLFYGSTQGSVFYTNERTFSIADICRVNEEQKIVQIKQPKVDKTYKPFTSKTDLQSLLDKFPFEDWLVDNYPEYDKITHKMKTCPICGHNDCFSYDPKTNRVTCFSANGNQGKSSSFIDFLVEAEGLTKAEAFDEFYALCGIPNPIKLQQNLSKENSDNTDITNLTPEQYLSKFRSCNPLCQLWNDIINKNTPVPTPTGFHYLDTVLEGGLRTGLTILGAMSSLGKTTFFLQMADSIANRGQDVLIISLEQTAYELLGKSMSRNTYTMSESNVDMAKTQYGIMDSKRYDNYSHTEKDLIEQAMLKQMETGKHLYIYEGHFDTSIDRIQSVIDKHIEVTGNHPVVIIDYLQLISPRSDRMTDTQAVKESVFGLTKIARKHNIPICVISAFNRASYKGEATMSSCKDTSSIEYTADVLLALQFAKCEDNNFNESQAKAESNDVRIPRDVELKILKNRGGRTGEKLSYNYYAAFNYFEERATMTTMMRSIKQGASEKTMSKEEFDAYNQEIEDIEDLDSESLEM